MENTTIVETSLTKSQLHVAETTVKTHVAHVLDKLDLKDRVQR